ncbi:MAG: hypothetical protein HY322_19240 [Betaproteobacteria bacterium]|nr:hypothetical protein [Betaproteobacteria bacterium]
MQQRTVALRVMQHLSWKVLAAIKEQLAEQMIAVVRSKSPDDFNAQLAEERKRWRQVVVENNITIQ